MISTSCAPRHCSAYPIHVDVEVVHSVPAWSIKDLNGKSVAANLCIIDPSTVSVLLRHMHGLWASKKQYNATNLVCKLTDTGNSRCFFWNTWYQALLSSGWDWVCDFLPHEHYSCFLLKFWRWAASNFTKLFTRMWWHSAQTYRK